MLTFGTTEFRGIYMCVIDRMASKRKNKHNLTLPSTNVEESNAAGPPLKKPLKESNNTTERIHGNVNEGAASHFGKGLRDKEKFQEEICKEDVTLLHELGTGSYAVVDKVRHKPSNLIMARKSMRPECNLSGRKRTMFELKTLHRCNSPFIICCYGYYYDDVDISVYMEYMDGGSMDFILGRVKQIPENILGVVTLSVLRGLKYLNEVHSILHRSVKPSNILVNLRGEVKLADFGLSVLSYQRPFMEQEWTRCYISPERLNGIPGSLSSDLWSLGISLIELATGKYPIFNNDKKNMSIFELLDHIVTQKPPKLPENCFSTDFSNFVDNCLEMNPNKKIEFTDLESDPWVCAASANQDRVDIAGFVYRVVMEKNIQDYS